MNKPPIGTKFPRSVKDPLYNTVLKSAEHNSKLGNGRKIITKGKWKGMPLYQLSLEEYATCPPCNHIEDCYTNNMPFAHRFKHGLMLQVKLAKELKGLFSKYNKIAIRLHVSGDFFSVAYVNFWEKQLELYPGLYIFGYTARIKDKIYETLHGLNCKYPDRFIVRYSVDRGYNSVRRFHRYAVTQDFNGVSIVCPEQIDKTDSCVTCGLCFNSNFKKSIKFLSH